MVAVVVRGDTGSIRVVIVLVRVVVAASSHIVNVPAAQGTGSAGVGELVLQVHHGAMVVFGRGGLEDGGLAARPAEKMASAAAHVTLPAQTVDKLQGTWPISSGATEGLTKIVCSIGNKSPRSSGDRVATYISVQSMPIYP